jgi:hypothetical protein
MKRTEGALVGFSSTYPLTDFSPFFKEFLINLLQTLTAWGRGSEGKKVFSPIFPFIVQFRNPKCQVYLPPICQE